jgi:hypothetical protein
MNLKYHDRITNDIIDNYLFEIILLDCVISFGLFRLVRGIGDGRLGWVTSLVLRIRIRSSHSLPLFALFFI